MVHFEYGAARHVSNSLSEDFVHRPPGLTLGRNTMRDFTIVGKSNCLASVQTDSAAYWRIIGTAGLSARQVVVREDSNANPTCEAPQGDRRVCSGWAGTTGLACEPRRRCPVLREERTSLRTTAKSQFDPFR
jgi:hypothetical protein